MRYPFAAQHVPLCARKYWDQIAKAIRAVYAGPIEAAAKERFVEFTAKWGAQYPAISRLWENAWSESCPSWTTTWKSVGSSAAPTRSSRSTPATGTPSGHGAIFGPTKLP
jgi:transposase-like protein